MTRVQKVVVVGRDAAAWIAALAVVRAVGRTGVKVTVLELPSLLEDSDVYAAVPSLAALHKLIGVDEALPMNACGAVPMIAQRFSNWSRSRPPFLHSYDAAVSGPVQDLDFLHYWLKARGQGLRVDYEDFSLAGVAAKQGRLPQRDQGPASFAAALGYQIDANRYAGLLKHLALKAGVEHRPGRVLNVEREEDRILSIHFEGDESFEGDLFIDASGPQAILIGPMAAKDFESWAEWLPCDQILTASAPPLRPLPAFAQVSAFRAGWIGLHPLQDRTAVVAAFSSQFAEDEVLRNLPALAGVTVQGEAVVTPFEPGMYPRPWIGNCVAIGDAAISLEPLDSVQLHLVHVGVSHLMALFPVLSKTMPEAESYNVAVSAHVRNVRDFQIAHYRLNQRFDQPFWDQARDAAGPASLDAKLELFASRGQVLLYDDESFQQPNWTSIFIGHGIIPASYDPRIDLVPQEEHMAQIQHRLRTIASEVNTMPTVEQYLSSMAARRAPQATF